MTKYVSKITAIFVAAGMAFALAGCDDTSSTGDAGTEGSGFVGSYMTKDTQGKDMSITLDEEGSATGTLDGKDLTGSWKDEGKTVVITWADGWTTKITKDGEGYSKTAFKDGKEEGSAVPAEKK